MTKVSTFKVALIITVVFSLLGVFFRISHYPYGKLLLAISFIASLVFIVLGLIDVIDNERSKIHEKIMWTIGFIFLSWIAGILYYPKFKQRNQ